MKSVECGVRNAEYGVQASAYPRAELSPAVKFLVEKAAAATADEYKFILESYNGKFALGMIKEALENIDCELVSSQNVSLLLRSIKQLERGDKR